MLRSRESGLGGPRSRVGWGVGVTDDGEDQEAGSGVGTASTSQDLAGRDRGLTWHFNGSNEDNQAAISGFAS